MKYLESVINSGLFNNLKKSEYIEAFEQLRVTGKTYSKGEAIFYEGDPISSICIIERGSVCGEKTYHNGEVHIIEVFEENSIIGLEVAMSRTKKAAVDYICNEETTMVFISMASITKSDYASKIQSMLIYNLADSNIRTANKVEILARRSLRERILIYLNILSKKAGSNTVTVRMNREQLAQFLCVNRSALSNELNKLKKEGIIDFRRDRFTIK